MEHAPGRRHIALPFGYCLLGFDAPILVLAYTELAILTALLPSIRHRYHCWHAHSDSSARAFGQCCSASLTFSWLQFLVLVFLKRHTPPLLLVLLNYMRLFRLLRLMRLLKASFSAPQLCSSECASASADAVVQLLSAVQQLCTQQLRLLQLSPAALSVLQPVA